MSFSLSAGVNIIEKDFTTIVPAVSSSAGAFAGAFAWGPVLDPQVISNENDLISIFGKPNIKNYVSFFSASNFLSYASNLLVNRIDTLSKSACAEPSGSVTSVTISAQSAIYKPGYTVVFNTALNGVTATGSLNLNPTTIDVVTVIAGGYGWDGVPKVVFSAATGDGAVFTPVIVDGAITGYTLVSGGSGYTGTVTASLSAGSGLGAVPGAVTVVNGAITAIAAGTSGTGYGVQGVPTISFTGGGGNGATATATIVNGAITAINMVSAGTGYTSNPQVNVTGTGLGFTGSVVLAGTTISSIYISNAGNGYRTTPTMLIKDTLGADVALPTHTVNAIFEGVTGLYNRQAHDLNFNGQVRTYGEYAAKYPGSLGNAIKISLADGGNFATWTYKDQFDSTPSTSAYASGVSGLHDEIHAIIIDNTGAISGTPGTILEKFSHMSKASDAKLPDGTNNYYMDVINDKSKYVWVLTHPSSADVGNVTVNWGSSAVTTTFAQLVITNFTYQLQGGTDGDTNLEYNITDAKQIAAYDMFNNSEMYDLSLIITGRTSTTVAKYISDNISDYRKDCMTFISPSYNNEPIIGNDSVSVGRAITFKQSTNINSSYAVIDSGWKYQYDKYNDKFWWVPLNADVAGLCARTDATNDPWFSPGGFNRGQIKNVIKLGINADKTARDRLYKEGINPIVTFPGQGVILYGDKTMLSKPSAFDRINVRRLFIVLEKAIAVAAKYQLFELNDSFTRAQFRSMVEPFLRDVQGRRGIYEFVVRCDESNNTGEVIDRNEFAGDIYIKPARSINFINLSFIAARTDVSFKELGA